MRTLRRYLTGHMVAGWALFAAVMGVLLLLVRLIEELERVSDRYTTGKVVLHVLLTLPQQLLTLTPVIVLVGTLTAFARLEQLNEMTVLRSAGVNKARLLRLLAMPLLALSLLLWGAMEWVTAPLHQWGEEIRSEARGNNTLEPGQSLWSRSGLTYYRLGRLGLNRSPGDIDIFEFGPDHRLLRAIHAERAEVIEGRRWRLEDTLVRSWATGTLQMQRVPELSHDQLWSRDELQRLLLSMDSMPPSVLYAYQDYLQRSGQSGHAHALALWSRLMLPPAAVGMALLALGLGVKPGSQRGGMGRQLAAGVLIGVLFYLGSQILVALGQIYHLSPLATAVVPVICILLAASVLLIRLRW
ncbi:MAG TPA: LPS export ABC transporter permease LptG [Thiohalobacter sp.]|nr:LPS export ABC transporter permease LptG [Thiohalobacter sp.]